MGHAPSQLSNVLANRYEIERELGHGGTAIVYLARDLKHHRLVAFPDPLSSAGPARLLLTV